MNYLDFIVRGRNISAIFLVIFVIIIFFIKDDLNYSFINIFLLFFSFIALLFTIPNLNKKESNKIKSRNILLQKNDTLIKPVILIISDEYASPIEMFKFFGDSSIFDFSKILIKMNWSVKNNFFSYETSTIHSMSSMFNFNLSLNKSYTNLSVQDLGANRLMRAVIYDSLENKKVKINNFGIFHIGPVKYLKKLYIYPSTFFESLMANTVLYTIIRNTGSLSLKGFSKNYYPAEDYNKFLLTNLVDTLSKNNSLKTFTYVHLLMPHSPFSYNPEFPLINNNQSNYHRYWNFTNAKLMTLLKELMRNKKYRIILTGDHGYRGDIRVNSHFTFASFYGFEQEKIDKIQSVQDIGSLINNSF
jgi:hypothetical protein